MTECEYIHGIGIKGDKANQLLGGKGAGMENNFTAGWWEFWSAFSVERGLVFWLGWILALNTFLIVTDIVSMLLKAVWR